jgi:hypothetical protein
VCPSGGAKKLKTCSRCNQEFDANERRRFGECRWHTTVECVQKMIQGQPGSEKALSDLLEDWPFDRSMLVPLFRNGVVYDTYTGRNVHACCGRSILADKIRTVKDSKKKKKTEERVKKMWNENGCWVGYHSDSTEVPALSTIANGWGDNDYTTWEPCSLTNADQIKRIKERFETKRYEDAFMEQHIFNTALGAILTMGIAWQFTKPRFVLPADAERGGESKLAQVFRQQVHRNEEIRLMCKRQDIQTPEPRSQISAEMRGDPNFKKIESMFKQMSNEIVDPFTKHLFDVFMNKTLALRFLSDNWPNILENATTHILYTTKIGGQNLRDMCVKYGIAPPVASKTESSVQENWFQTWTAIRNGYDNVSAMYTHEGTIETVKEILQRYKTKHARGFLSEIDRLEELVYEVALEILGKYKSTSEIEWAEFKEVVDTNIGNRWLSDVDKTKANEWTVKYKTGQWINEPFPADALDLVSKMAHIIQQWYKLWKLKDDAIKRRMAEAKRLADAAEAERQRLAKEKQAAEEQERRRLAEEKRIASAAKAERQREAKETQAAEQQRLANIELEKKLALAQQKTNDSLAAEKVMREKLSASTLAEFGISSVFPMTPKQLQSVIDAVIDEDKPRSLGHYLSRDESVTVAKRQQSAIQTDVADANRKSISDAVATLVKEDSEYAPQAWYHELMST